MFLCWNYNTVDSCGPIKPKEAPTGRGFWQHRSTTQQGPDPQPLWGFSSRRAVDPMPAGDFKPPSAPPEAVRSAASFAPSVVRMRLHPRARTAHAPPLILLTHVLHRRKGSPFLLQSGCWARACALIHFLSRGSQWGGASGPLPPPPGRRRPPGAAQRQDGGGRRRGGAGLGGGGAAAALRLLLGLRDERAPAAARLRYREVRAAAAGWDGAAPGPASPQAARGPEVLLLGGVRPHLSAVCGVGPLTARKTPGLWSGSREGKGAVRRLVHCAAGSG